MLSGERQRERVLTTEEEQKYLGATVGLGHKFEDSYRRALEGIRATKRGEQPKRPDSYLLRDVSTILIDCALRPEECHRLKWQNIRDGAIEIFTGKRKLDKPAADRLFAISTAYVTLETSLEIISRGSAAIVFQSLATADFTSIVRYIEDRFGLPRLSFYDRRATSIGRALDLNQRPLTPLVLRERTCPFPPPTR